MNSIIVFGATGTVGAYTVKELAGRGYNIAAVGRRKSDNGFFETLGVQYISLDIADKKQFSRLPAKVDVVVHLAGAMPARMQDYNPQNYIDSIVTGTLNILEYSVKNGVKKVIYSQSISDIDYLCGDTTSIPSDTISKFPINNDHSVYSICKNMAINLIEHYSAKYGFCPIYLRLPNIYVYHPNPYYYVDGIKKWQSYRLMIDKALKGDALEVWGNPNRVRDIVYIKDLIQIILKAIEANVEGGMYNVGTGVGVSLDEQIKGIVEVFSPKEKPSEIIYRRDMPDAAQYIFDISKTCNELGYVPQYYYRDYLLDMKKEMTLNPFAELWRE